MEWRYALLNNQNVFKLSRNFSSYFERLFTKLLFLVIRAISVNEGFFVMHTFRKIGSNAKS